MESDLKLIYDHVIKLDNKIRFVGFIDEMGKYDRIFSFFISNP